MLGRYKLRLSFLWLTACCSLTIWQSASCHDDELETVIVSESPTHITDPVQFLEHAPTIDGILDDDLFDLAIRAFTRIRYDDFEGSLPDANYRLAYGTDFFYLYLEAEADSLIFRDRAYQMGDGFHMTLGKALPENEPTEEFYVLACSAVDKPRMEWTRRIFWYYNMHDIFVRTSEDTRLEFHDGDGVIGFELLLPWKDVHPYHPWISEGIGFNLRFVNAVGEEGKIRYDVVHDNCIGCELKTREYAILTFQEPTLTGDPQTFVQPNRGHIYEGDNLVLTAVTAAGSSGEESITVFAHAGEGDAVAYKNTTYAFDAGTTNHSFGIDTKRLIPGGYKLMWQTSQGDSEEEIGLTVLPPFDPDEIRSRLTEISFNLPRSSISTLEFKVNEIAAQIDSTKSYETCLGPRFRLARVKSELEKALDGKDPYSMQTGFIRKAHRSYVDSTLQPYMIWVPEDYEPNKSYQLLVYLHGSASTEYNLMDYSVRKMIPDGFIALAPRGRGTSNCFTFDYAQEDIAEAIAAVITDYPIDTTRIILSGFSMGGYGVYRTFYETPEKFAALAVFSGNPNIAESWYPGNSYPNFTDPEMISLFRDIPLFIFHGVRDRNAPYEITEAFVKTLNEMGSPVEFHPEPDKGHEEPSEETFEAYRKWVQKVLTKK